MPDDLLHQMDTTIAAADAAIVKAKAVIDASERVHRSTSLALEALTRCWRTEAMKASDDERAVYRRCLKDVMNVLDALASPQERR